MGELRRCALMIGIITSIFATTNLSASETFHFEIAAGPAHTALNQYALITGRTLLFPYDLVSPYKTNAVVGNLSADEALIRMLEQSGLTTSLSDKGNIIVEVEREQQMNKVGKGNEPHAKKGMSTFRQMSMALFTMLAGGGMSEQVTAGENEIEEIIVTAQKREQSVQDVAASISVLGQDALNSRGVRDFSDLQFMVPSVHFGTELGDQEIAIRGIGAYNRQPGVAISVDGVYQSRTTTANLYQLDVSRVEVMRGPQGTLYGKNSNGGVVNFVTNKPTWTPQGALRISYSEFDETSVYGMFSGPLTEKIAVRIAGDYTQRGEGWIKNHVDGQNDMMEGEFTNFRMKLLADVTTDFSVELMYAAGTLGGPLEQYTVYTDNRDLATGGIPQLASANLTVEPLKVFADTETDVDRRYDLASVTATWDLKFGTFKSITGYQEFDDYSRTDRDAMDVPAFDVYDNSTVKTLSQEFNLAGVTDRLDWVIGLYYMNDSGQKHGLFNSAFPIFGLPLPVTLDFNQHTYETDSYAGFVDMTWAVTERTHLSFGLRQTKDKLSEAHTNRLLLQTGATPIVAAQTCDQGIEQSWSETTLRVVGQYDLSDFANIYGSYSEGYKAGGVATTECNPSYNPEFIDAFEVGYKGVLAGGSARLSSALFYYDYRDFQSSQVVGLSTATRNVGDAEVFGAEIELSTQLGESWNLSAGYTWLDATYGDFLTVDSFHETAGFQNMKGNPLNKAPEHSVNIGVTYGRTVPWSGRLRVGADVAYRSRIYFREFGDIDDSQAPVTVVNLHALWEDDNDEWQVRLFVKNATGQEYIASLLAAATAGGRFATWGTPRTIGIEVSRKFGGQ